MPRARSLSTWSKRALVTGALATVAVPAYGECRTAAGSEPAYRVVGKVYAVIGVTDSKDPRDHVFDIYVRLNRAVPRVTVDGSRASGAVILLAGRGGAGHAQRVGRRSRHCYVGDVEPLDPPKALRRAKPGRHVRYEVVIDGVKRPLRGTAEFIADERRPERRLGC